MKKFLPKHNKKQNVTNWKTRYTTVIVLIFYIGIWFFAMIPFTETPLAESYKLFWIIEIFAVVIHGFYTDSTGIGTEYSLGGLVASMLFIAQIIAHLTILWDSFCMRKKRFLLYQKFVDLDLRLVESKLEVPINITECDWNWAFVLSSILFQLIFWHTAISWTTFNASTKGTALFWDGFLSTIALQFRILEFLAGIVFLNSRLLVLRSNIDVIGERNLKRIFKPFNKFESKHKKGNYYQVLPFQHENEDERQLIIIKSIYNDIFKTFRIMNDCYSWSLLAFTALYFIDFVTNSYWIVLAMITQGRDNLAFFQNGGFLWIVVVMLWMVCWHCQKSYNYSRQIGCLIFKLVKPLGNKRYNDLVSEFSLQTMHQQFVVTAKAFFNLNLNLLGSMVAAIVTYLVILIQFMFTEKSNLERSIPTLVTPINVTISTAVTEPLDV